MDFPRFCKPPTKEPTRYIFASGFAPNTTDIEAKMRETFAAYGEFDESFNGGVMKDLTKRICYIIYTEVDHAVNAVTHLSLHPLVIDGYNITIKYASIKKPSTPPPEPECTSSTVDIQVPGMMLIPDFISPDEEAYLLDTYATRDMKWETNISRRVQHYGYKFNYDTLALDPRKVPPVPEPILSLVRRQLHNHWPQLESPTITQMTINEYIPGQGISPHIDTPSSFGAEVFILSAESGIVMTFVYSPPDDVPQEEFSVGTKKHLFLPPRSLLVLRNDARYHWSHGIAPRKMDKVDGEVVRRSRRVSFTFREGLLIPATPIQPPKVPRFKANENNSGDIKSSAVEEEHVFRVYDSIATHWHHTRGKRKVYWQRVKAFLDSLPPGSLLADIGCGDGKYFGVNPNVVCIGCDRSSVLLQVSKTDESEAFCCDAVKLPFRSDIFDFSICIAVLHHLASEGIYFADDVLFMPLERRLAVIREILRILKPGGVALVQAWALEQESDSKRAFTSQDVFVPWKLQQHFADSEDKKELTFQRYCHVYQKGELEELCNKIPGCSILSSGYDKSNWFVEIRREASCS